MAPGDLGTAAGFKVTTLIESATGYMGYKEGIHGTRCWCYSSVLLNNVYDYREVLSPNFSIIFGSVVRGV